MKGYTCPEDEMIARALSRSPMAIRAAEAKITCPECWLDVRECNCSRREDDLA